MTVGGISVAFLGPKGTFSEEALMSQPDLARGIHIPMTDVYEVVHSVETGDVDLGIVPLENSIEGSVNATLDALTFESEGVLIEREVVIDVDLNLLGVSGSSLESIATVFTHPHALAQCRAFIAGHMPEARVEAAISTADAARRVADAGDPSLAAVATKLAADIYGLHVIVEGIADYAGNATRFVVLGRSIPAATGHDKTSVVCFQAEDRPGSLLEILQEFAARSINLTKIESRPTKKGLGQYCFLVDFEGHVSDAVVGDVLKHLHMKLADLKFLGSYPSATSGAKEHRERAAGAWAQADAYLEQLRSRITPQGSRAK
jgi:prephenate dehydratase